MSIIRAQNVSFRYGKTDPLVLRDVSFTAPAGKITGIIGPNGSGKTTLLRMVSGYLKPQSGVVLLDDVNVASLRAREISRKMALVAQRVEVDYDFSAFEIVLSGRNPYISRFSGESPEDREKAGDSLAMVGIEHLRDRMISELSGGELRLVMLARALCQEAPVMLLDEPVTGLDIRHQMQFMSILTKISQLHGITVLHILHDLNLCLSHCDEVLLLKSGSVFAQGVPRAVLTKEVVEEVYETPVLLTEQGGVPYILPLRV